MPIIRYLIFILIIFHNININAQQKTIVAKQLSGSISIDGILDEKYWEEAAIATNFVMNEPDNGAPSPLSKNSEVKVLYDNHALYIGAKLYDDDPSKILKEITQRDFFGTADHFGVYINGFNDGQQDFRFYVSASGVQIDCLSTEGNNDYDWDAIWYSAVKTTDFGWSVEMKLPYAALRFSNESVQTWGINFYREIKRDRQLYTWNLVDLKIGNALPQTGILTGIENIETPTRLFLIPYSAYYYNDAPDQKEHSFKAGLDIKYGINDSFTLDAILVPDFGQTKYDNVILNLSPFEQRFIENRPFFTEGTDLFNKGDLLYTRRIGGQPSTYYSKNDPEVSIKNPNNVNLINATKVSGRTSKGLGIGVLNAITEKTYAIETNLNNQDQKKILVEPLANYNVLVLDQRFNKNSSVSFVNTNVTRNGHFRDANVSAVIFDINDKKNKFFVNGDFKYSYINEFADQDNYDGYFTSLQLGKKGGKWRYNAGASLLSKNYDPNDLGINFITNFNGYYTNLSYRILNPNKTFNLFRINKNIYTEFNNTSGKIQQAQINFDVSATTLKNNYIKYELYLNPLEIHDYYEPRDGSFVILPKSYYSSFYLSTNYNHPFALDINPYTKFTEQKNRWDYGLTISPRYRVNNRFLITYNFDYYIQNNDQGNAGIDPATDKVVFSRRFRKSISNELGLKYAFSPTMSLNLSTRHYWSYAENNQFLTLLSNGRLEENNTFNQNTNSDFATFNFDLTYSWWLAPGSQLSIMYRNSTTHYDQTINKKFQSNFSNLINNNLNNILSISLRYFLDYNQIKSKI